MFRQILVVSSVLMVGCGAAPTSKAKPIVVEFEPALAEPKLPLPNLLAIDPDTQLIDAVEPRDANDAEKAFYVWLRTLNGFPMSSVATIEFSGDVDNKTISETSVRLFDVTSSAPQVLKPKSIEYVPASRQLKLKYAWLASHSYAIAVVGGEKGVKTADGKPVEGTRALELLRVPYPLVTCTNLKDSECRSANPAIRGKTLADERKKAIKMELSRQALRPVIETLEKEGIDSADLASLSVFRIHNEVASGVPRVNFEPAIRAIPFPSDALMKDGHPQLPEESDDEAFARTSKAQLALLDGFSTTAGILTERQPMMGAAGVDIDPSSVNATQFRLVDLDANKAPAPFTFEVLFNPDHFALRPTQPLRGHHRYAVVWVKGAKSKSGEMIGTSPAWEFLMAGIPLVDGQGKSRVRTLDDENAQDLERLRKNVVEGVEIAVGLGVARNDVLLAWTFTTQTTSATLPGLRAKPAEWNLPTDVTGIVDLPQVALLSAISTVAGKDFHSHVRSALEGTFVTGNALDFNSKELDLTDPLKPVEVGTEGPFSEALLKNPRREQLIFMLTLPMTPKFQDGRIPIIIFQHGINGFRRHAGLIANTISKRGYAMLAIDHPLHGDRSYCTADDQCAAGFKCKEHRCPPGAYNVGDNDLLAQIGTPLISGGKFGPLTNLGATRDQIRQLVIDTAQLIRVVKDVNAGIGSLDVDDPKTTVVEKLDVSELGYIGLSLGSVMGTTTVAAQPEITRATFNVGGASPADILLKATVPFLADKRVRLENYLKASRGIEPGSQRYEDFFEVARWILDPADAQNAARHYIDEPFPMYPKKKIFVSWVKDDPWIPNPTTQRLIDSSIHESAPANFKEHQWIAGGNHGFMIDYGYSEVLVAQEEAVDWIALP